MSRRKAMTSKKARNVRKQGHLDALEFAKAIGLERDYLNNPIAKKDVVDSNGDTHSVKSGSKRWQIFLYGKNRFESDAAFQTMNGIGQILIECLNVFPPKYEDYTSDKQLYKERLKNPMRQLKNKFIENKVRLKAFLNKSFFNDGEVNYLTVKQNDIFHVFLKRDVITTFSDNFEICNSQARIENETSEQKVLFRYKGKNVGELEVRNSGENHYKEVLFVMNKLKAMDLLLEKIPFTEKYNDKVYLYGDSKKLFNKKS